VNEEPSLNCIKNRSGSRINLRDIVTRQLADVTVGIVLFEIVTGI
jgi:hypothetical protein